MGEVFWLHNGDNNTRAFHLAATGRKRKNQIKQLRGDDGEWYEKGNGIEDVVSGYFRQLFTSEKSDSASVIREVKRRVTAEHNDFLLGPFVVKEVKEALFSMHSDKALGVDGYILGFFQKFWGIVGGAVTSACLQWLNECKLPEGVNDIVIVLIPKKQQPTYMVKHRPISLCNIMYKIVSKVFTNRLKYILPELVSENQTAFIPGRLITDNVIIAYEIAYHMRQKWTGVDSVAALKIDISKAYDKVEWTYLKKMLRALGFAKKWINLVMEFVTTVRFNVLFENEMLGLIMLERGLRQGDPLSPYFVYFVSRGLVVDDL